MTTYAISNHLLAKGLISLNYMREAKVFLSKASTLVNKVLNTKRHDLQAAIQNDIAALGRAMRTFANAKVEPTEEQIERTFTSIKTELITQATAEAPKALDKAEAEEGAARMDGAEKQDDGPPVATLDEAKQELVLESMVAALEIDKKEAAGAGSAPDKGESEYVEPELSERAKKALKNY